jgi:hypothetical protein
MGLTGRDRHICQLDSDQRETPSKEKCRSLNSAEISPTKKAWSDARAIMIAEEECPWHPTEVFYWASVPRTSFEPPAIEVRSAFSDA